MCSYSAYRIRAQATPVYSLWWTCYNDAALRTRHPVKPSRQSPAPARGRTGPTPRAPIQEVRTCCMERDPRSNREQVPIAALRPTPVEPATLPPPARRRRRRGLNPWYFVLIGGIPILVLGIMLATVAQAWPPRGMSVVPTATVVWSQIEQLALEQGSIEPDPASGPGWYIVNAQLTNNSQQDLFNINVRAFCYDEEGRTIGSGVIDSGELAPGQRVPLAIQAQLINGPVPGPGTPTPPALSTYASCEAKIIAVFPKATPTQ
jgi:hypothetical protein